MGRFSLRPKPPYVSYYLDRHKKLRWRFRRKGLPQTQTREPFGSEAWWSWYAAASQATPIVVGASKTKPGSVHALAVAFYASADFQRLSQATQRTYRGILDRYRDKYGDNPVALLEARHVRAQMDKQAATPAAANNMLKVLRAAMRFGLERGLIRTDPTAGIKMLRYRSEGFHTWTEPEVAAFEKRWPVGTKERLAFDLLLYTAQRSGDVRQMTKQQVQGGRVTVRQEKTGQLVDIRQHPQLRGSLAASASDRMVLLTTEFGRPFTAKGFGNWISKAAERAGLPHCSAHGLRKAAARRLAEAGCSAHQIMAITGHQTLKEVERYTRDAGRRNLADSAMERIGISTQAEQAVSNPTPSVRQNGE